MKKNRKTLLIASIMITAVMIIAVIWGFIALEKGTGLLKGIDLFIFILIVVIGIIAFISALKKDKEKKEGLPPDDELSMKIKYKSGYYAFLVSMYMWLFIFILKDKFPDTETMLGGGILLSALIFAVTKYVIKQKFNE
ncbi:MAG: hypothetical protein GXO83_06085 [Chlorobi bacterium]|nr:hypothetical protein [Chlorobiota bacterium]